MLQIDEDFAAHILQNYSLTSRDLEMLLDDLEEYFNVEVTEFIRNRHIELQKKGLKNNEIYLAVKQELLRFRFTAPDLSIRQIRRIIYG